jgi:hypothetical protein
METPYGEIPEKFVKDMSAQEMHDYLQRRHSRRRFLKGAGALGLAAAAGPIFWKQSYAAAASPATPAGAQWIAYGPDPATEMWVSWAAGSSTAAANVPSPIVRYGLNTGYGATVDASTGMVPTPAAAPAGNTELTSYQHALITDLLPDTTYHYSVSNDNGTTWGPDTTFRTGKTGLVDFRFCATADENSYATSSKPIMDSISGFNPDFTIVAGDLSYAADDGTYSGSGPVATYTPSAWDSYFAVLGANGGQSIPWMVGPGNHDVEPFTDNGFAGLITRFPHFGSNAANAGSGSQVVQSFTYSNVGIIGLDDSDISTLDTVNNGYTSGQQTSWFEQQLQKYRAAGSGIDFIVVFFHHCPYCSGGPGSDGGDRTVWQPLFDRYNVDLVINGHNHLYERAYPMIGGVIQAQTPSGGTVTPATQGTTYICTGGGGQGLAATATSGWYGPSGGGDETTLATTPPLEVYSGGETATGGSGKTESEPDPETGWSAFRKGQYVHLVIDVLAPSLNGGQTSMYVRAIDPTQSGSTITSISPPNVIDSITLVRDSVIGPTSALPEAPDVALLGLAAAGALGAGAYLHHRRQGSADGRPEDQPA